MTLPVISGVLFTPKRPKTIPYGEDAGAIHKISFVGREEYYVTSKRLAIDIMKNNADYDSSVLARGLKDGWLQLVISPTTFAESRNPLTAIRAIKKTESPEDGWYDLYILPAKNSYLRGR
jgi:hypothetical protein